MGGDQQDELLKTIMEKYSSLITVVIILVSIALIMILFGIIKSIIDASKAKKLALAGGPALEEAPVTPVSKSKAAPASKTTKAVPVSMTKAAPSKAPAAPAKKPAPAAKEVAKKPEVRKHG